MNPHADQPTSFRSLMRSMFVHRALIQLMIRRDVIGRYRRSAIGLLWSFFNPLLMLAIYAFVFTVVFKARWSVETDDKGNFALILFIGMIVHALFAEVMARAPNLIVANTNFVKKVVFPLEILPVVTLGAALFHALISFGVVLLGLFFFADRVPWTVVFLPVVIAPLLLLVLGMAWGLSSLGVFFRDVTHPVTLLTSVLLFVSPVFYPVSALPEYLRPWVMLNPLSFVIEQARAVLIGGHYPNWQGLLLYSTIALLIMWVGYFWFQKTRKGFANVL